MRVVLQRVSRAEVRIDGRVAGCIGKGFALLVGFSRADTDEVLVWMADKVIGLRLFGDTDDTLAIEPTAGAKPQNCHLGLADIGGGVLVVSQFTLYGDASKGRRPSFSDAAAPGIAMPLYETFVALLRARAPGPVETGEFGAMMEVDLVNDGPVTLILER